MKYHAFSPKPRPQREGGRHAERVKQLRNYLREQAQEIAVALLNTVDCTEDVLAKYRIALEVVERCRGSLKALINECVRENQVVRSKKHEKKRKRPRPPNPPNPVGDNPSDRIGKVPVGGGFIHSGQGQTRKPGSRKSQA